MKRFLLFALVATIFVACTTDQTQDIAVRIEVPETLTVSFEENSRIQLQDGKTVWTKGDLVSVFYRSNANSKWQFQGQTGERTGNLKCIANGQATQELSDIVVVYPYNESYYINPRTCNIQASLPATQTYLADSYGLNGNIMISQSEYNQIALKSVCGWLKVQLTGNGEKIKSITLNGNNGEQVAGQVYINSADATCTLAAEDGLSGDDSIAGGNLVFDDTIFTSVTLDCGEGVTLGSEPTAFYIALPPQEFSKGLTIEIEATNGSKMTKSTTNAIVIERNHIVPMTAIEPQFPIQIPNNEIWYTSTDGNIVTPYNSDVFGVNIVSNIYKEGNGIIKFDGDVTMIGDDAFNNCDKLTTITLPEGVISIGNNAFYGCKGLTEFTIPDGVTSIGNYAFYSCNTLTAFYGKFASADNRCIIIDGVLRFFARKGLTEYTIPDSVTSIGDSAFSSCSSLESVIIPNSVTKIGSGAFSSCSSLTSITIPDSVTLIGSYVFQYCSSLKEVYCKPTTPPSGRNSMFDNNAIGRKIYVPRASVAAYMVASYWRSYASDIVGYDFTDGTDEINGLDDSTLDTNKYLEYVANQSTKFQLTSSRDYNVWETYFTNEDYSAVEVAEYKFQLPSVCDEWTPISDDYIEIYNHRISVYSYTYYDEDDERRRKYVTCDLSTAGISPTDVITLRVDSINGVVTINNVEFYGTVSTAMYKYLFSSYYSEWDEGQYRSYSGITDGTKLYYAKGWDTDGNLIYMGHAAKQVNPDTNNVEACWKSQNYNNGTITEKATFANNNYVTTYIPLGMGNL